MWHFYPLSALLCLSIPHTGLANVILSASKASPPAGVPKYVITHAPLVYLYSDEQYGPSDLSTHLGNTFPALNLNPVDTSAMQPLTLDNLDILSTIPESNGGKDIYLTSNEDVTANPPWLNGELPDANHQTSGKNNVIITADRGNGIVDAFYMYFYSFNWGGLTLRRNLGNHVGDWEHNMVRFKNGVPQAMWFSQHAGGQAFTWKAVSQTASNGRPLVYSANGTHANYAIPGPHEHTTPVHIPASGLLTDFTNKGFLWDPTKSAYWYEWIAPDSSSDEPSTPSRDTAELGTFRPYDPADPVGFLYFKGHWGDKAYPASDGRQSGLGPIEFGPILRYVDGPTGPASKDLGRSRVSAGKAPENIHNGLIPRI